MKKLKEESKWHLMWSRKYTPFIAVSYFLIFQKDTSIWSKCQNKLFIPEGGLHSYYCNTKELYNICDKFEKYVLKQNIQKFCQKYEEIFKEWLNWSIKINKQNLAELSDDSICRLIEEVATKLVYYGEWQFLSFIALEGLVKKAETFVNSQADLKNLLFSLSTPHQETKIMKARIELLKIVINSNSSNQLIEKYCSKYAWLNMYEFIDPPLSSDDISKGLPTKSAARNEIEDYIKNRKENLKAFKMLMTKVKGPQHKKLLLVANRFAYLKELRDDYRRPSFLIFQPFWNEIAKRTGLNFVETNYLLADELKNAIKKPNKKWQILARKRINVFALELSGGKFFIYSEQKIIDKLLSRVSLNLQDKKITGMTAFPGRATGRIKIIYHKNEFTKFKKGDILVTAMTHTEFLPIMRQASAIITDEGGITCHAAIVAREIKKPCIIGAKIATKTLNDGDIVEIDASKGVVRKLSY